MLRASGSLDRTDRELLSEISSKMGSGGHQSSLRLRLLRPLTVPPTIMFAEKDTERPLLPRQAATTGTPLRGGVFVLANTILGAGMLGLPFAFAACGFLLGPVMLCIFASCSSLALVLLSESADAVGRPATFNSVAERAMPGSGVLIDLAVAIKCFGVATSYLIVIGDSVPKSMVALGGSGFLLQRRFWTLAALAIAAPLAYMRRITALRHVSLVALTCVMLITLMVVTFAFKPSAAFDPCPVGGGVAESCPPGPTVLLTDASTTLRALPLFVFSYTCHQNIFSITNELASPTRTRNAMVAVTAVGTALCVYIVLGGSGYATFGSKVGPCRHHRQMPAWRHLPEHGLTIPIPLTPPLSASAGRLVGGSDATAPTSADRPYPSPVLAGHAHLSPRLSPPTHPPFHAPPLADPLPPPLFSPSPSTPTRAHFAARHVSRCR